LPKIEKVECPGSWSVASGPDQLFFTSHQNLDRVIRQEVIEVLRDCVLQEYETMMTSSYEIYDLEELQTDLSLFSKSKVL